MAANCITVTVRASRQLLSTKLHLPKFQESNVRTEQTKSIYQQFGHVRWCSSSHTLNYNNKMPENLRSSMDNECFHQSMMAASNQISRDLECFNNQGCLTNQQNNCSIILSRKKCYDRITSQVEEHVWCSQNCN